MDTENQATGFGQMVMVNDLMTVDTGNPFPILHGQVIILTLQPHTEQCIYSMFAIKGLLCLTSLWPLLYYSGRCYHPIKCACGKSKREICSLQIYSCESNKRELLELLDFFLGWSVKTLQLLDLQKEAGWSAGTANTPSKKTVGKIGSTDTPTTSHYSKSALRIKNSALEITQPRISIIITNKSTLQRYLR